MKPTELKRLRQRLGLTQAQLAMKLGVTWNTVARWEVGIRRIPELAARLVAVLAKGKKPTKKKR